MAVYAKNISDEWKEAFQAFESISGFEVLFQDDINSGALTPQQAWDANMQWFEGVMADVQNIHTPFDEDET